MDSLDQKRWIFYPWIKDQELDYMIHPAFVSVAYELGGIGVSYCLGQENDWLQIAIKEHIIHVSASNNGMSVLPDPQFVWNEYVMISHKGIIAVVSGIGWHFKRSQYYYYLQGHNRLKKKKYYLQSDLVSLYRGSQ